MGSERAKSPRMTAAKSLQTRKAARPSTSVASLLLLTSLFFLPLTTLVLLSPVVVQSAEAAPPEYVLFLGNSFQRGIKGPLGKMLRENADTRTKIKSSSPTGWTLFHHNASSRTTKRLDQRPWDWVVLQEQSDGIDDERYPDARDLEEKLTNRGFNTMFFMTWRDRGDPLEDYDSLRGVIGGSEGYVPIADELGAPIAPVGWAVRNAAEDGTPYDLWSRDGHHLSKAGRYLAACVLYAVFTGETPVGNFSPNRFVSDGSAAYLQQMAHDTVFTAPEDWFLSF
jgi:hypothetical protein